MSTYLFPDWLHPDSFGMQMPGNVKANQSPMNFAVKTVENPGDLWIVRAEFPPMPRAQYRRAQAYFNRLRGMAHRMRIWNLDHPYPAGTMRGNPTCAAAPEGASQVVITASSGATLIEGDWIGIPLQSGLVKLCNVAGASTSGSTITVDISPPLPQAVNAGAAVVWNRPTVDCILTQAPFLPVITGGVGDEFSFEAIEVPV